MPSIFQFFFESRRQPDILKYISSMYSIVSYYYFKFHNAPRSKFMLHHTTNSGAIEAVEESFPDFQGCGAIGRGFWPQV